MSDTQARIKSLVDADRIVLFIKGTPEFPQCGFSMRAVNVVRALGQPYASYNVLEDYELREGIKQFANWPTIPQLYINGQFIGGSDIMMELFEAGELQQMVGKAS